MYTAKKLENVSNGEGSWQSTRIGIFKDDIQVGEFLRNYGSYGESTFVPFRRGMLGKIKMPLMQRLP
jgi:hypothetical protein